MGALSARALGAKLGSSARPVFTVFQSMEEVQEEVKKEPYHALVADDNGLIFYKKILSNFENLCKSNGIIFFEIGAYQAGSICDYAAECNLYAECVKDYINNDRVIVVKNSKRGI